MAITNRKPFTIRPFGVCDAIDGSNAPPGAMAALTNLIPSPTTRNQFVPRPASIKAANFSGFNTPGQPVAQLVLGNLVWGMVPSARNPGFDEPFCYNILSGAFVAIAGVTSGNVPSTQPTSGDWTPPVIASITNGRLVITHPGYNFASGFAIGWIDTSSFVSADITGTTHATTTIDTLSADVLTVAGWQVGYAIAGPGIPAATYITAIAADGLSITISQAATASTAGVTFTVSGGTPTAPLYGAGQTAPVALVGQPVSVALFTGRAYYAIDNYLQYSDSEFPTQITNVSQALVLGDSTAINALTQLPLTNQVTGGTTAALIAFKGAESFFQITGDAALSTLAQSAVPSSVGTLAPNTICGVPQGVAFIAPDGLRILGFGGTVSDPIGDQGMGVNAPFVYAVNPTRMCMAYNQNTLRVTVQNGLANGEPNQEYWYNLTRKAWTGPHSFPAALISAYFEGDAAIGFIVTGAGIPGALWSSTAAPGPNSTYTENGLPLTFAMTTTLLPDNEQAAMNSVVESTLTAALPAQQALTITAADENGNVIGSVVVSGTGQLPTTWGSFTWGAAVWASSQAPMRQIQLPWQAPLVFKQMSLTVTGNALAGLVIGNVYAPYSVLGYLLGDTYGVSQVAPPPPPLPPAPPPSPPAPPSGGQFVLDQSALDGPDTLS